MPEPTPNLGYDRPNPGTTDWHVPINENFAAIDEDLAPFSVTARPTTDVMAEPDGTVPIPLDASPIEVPYNGSYLVVGTVEADTGPLTEPVYGATVLTVNGERVEVESAPLVPVAAGPEFQSVTAPYRLGLQAGDTPGLSFAHHAPDPLRVTSQPWNTKLAVTRIGPG